MATATATAAATATATATLLPAAAAQSWTPAPGHVVPSTTAGNYSVLGSIAVGTMETTIFLREGRHYLLENIGCGFIDHYGQWDPRFTNHSYASEP